MRGLLDQQPAQQHAAARPHRRGERAARARSSGPARMLATTRSKGARACEFARVAGRRLARSGRDRRRRSIRHSRARRRPLRRRCRRPAPGAATAWPWRWRGCRCRCRHRRRWPSRAGSSVASISRQPRVVACVPVPKARPASILSGSSAGRHAVGDMRGMDPERARLRRAGRSADSPPPSRSSGSSSQCGPGASPSAASTFSLASLAEDLDAPRPVARDLAAGHDKSVLGQMFQRLFPRQTLDRRDHERRLPGAHAASMKLSKTFFGPAFSNSMSSLLPSTARMRP